MQHNMDHKFQIKKCKQNTLNKRNCQTITVNKKYAFDQLILMYPLDWIVLIPKSRNLFYHFFFTDK